MYVCMYVYMYGYIYIYGIVYIYIDICIYILYMILSIILLRNAKGACRSRSCSVCLFSCSGNCNMCSRRLC